VFLNTLACPCSLHFAGRLSHSPKGSDFLPTPPVHWFDQMDVFRFAHARPFLPCYPTVHIRNIPRPLRLRPRKNIPVVNDWRHTFRLLSPFLSLPFSLPPFPVLPATHCANLFINPPQRNTVPSPLVRKGRSAPVILFSPFFFFLSQVALVVAPPALFDPPLKFHNPVFSEVLLGS